MVKLFKRIVSYKDKEGNDKKAINFYLSNEEGQVLIPINVCYFPNDDGKDPGFQGRKGFLEGLAETLVEQPPKGSK